MKAFEDILIETRKDNPELRSHAALKIAIEKYANYKASIAWQEGRDSNKIVSEQIGKYRNLPHGELKEKWIEINNKSKTNPYL